jgi:hypothetical protein
MNRRELIAGLTLASSAVAGAAGAQQAPAAKAGGPVAASPGATIYVSPSGSDANAGTKDSPIQTLVEAAKRVNASTGSGAITVILSEGIYPLGAEAHFTAPNHPFTKTERLTIRAEFLPDDPDWHSGRMPTLIHTMVLEPKWNGRPIPNGKTSNGIVIETSHVTIQGLKVLGVPVVETPVLGEVNRVYPIGRFDAKLDDLEICQCFFGGDRVTAPNHCPIIANGSGMSVHHCIFYGTKLTAVYWTYGSAGHSMHHCLMYGCYEGGPWTALISNDFVYTNNVIAETLNAWVQQPLNIIDTDTRGPARPAGGPPAPPPPPRPVLKPTDGHYKIVNSLFAHDGRLTVSGTGSNLGFKDIDATFLTLINSKVTDEPVLLNRDQWSRDYLHPLPGTEAAATGAGLFMKRPA